MWNSALQNLQSLGSIGTTLLEQTEQYAKELTVSQTQLLSADKNEDRPSETKPNDIVQRSAPNLESTVLTSAVSTTSLSASTDLSTTLPSASNEAAWIQRNKQLEDTLEKLRMKAKTKINELQDQVNKLLAENKDLNSRPPTDNDDIVKALQADLEQTMLAIQEKDVQLNRLREELSTGKAIHAELEQKNTAVSQLQEELRNVQSELANKSSVIAQNEESLILLQQQLYSFKHNQGDVKRLEDDNANLREQNQKDQQLIQELQSQLKELPPSNDTELINQLRRELSDMSNRAKEEKLQADKMVQSLKAEVTDTQAISKEQMDSLKKLLIEKENELSDLVLFREENTSLKAQLSQLLMQSQSDKMAPELESLRQQIAQKDENHALALAEITKTKNELENRVADLEKQLSSNTTTSPDLVEELQKKVAKKEEEMNVLLQEYESLQESFDGLERSSREQLKSLNQQLNDKTSSSQDLNSYQEQISRLEEALSTQQNANLDLKTKLEAVSSELNDIKKKSNRVDELSVLLDDKNAQFVAMTEQFQADKQQLRGRIEELEHQLQSAVTQQTGNQALQETLTSLNNELESTQIIMKEKSDRINELELQVSELRKNDTGKSADLQKLQDELDVANQNFAAASDRLVQMKDLLKKKDDIVNTIQKEAGDLQDNFNNQLEAANNEIQQLRMDVEKFRPLASKTGVYEQELGMLRDELKTRTVELEEARSTVSSSETHQKELAARTQELEQLQKAHQELMKRFQENSEAYEAMNEQLDQLRSEITKKENDLQRQKLETDQVKENNALLISNLERDVEAIKNENIQQIQELRETQIELQKISQERDNAQKQNVQLQEKFSLVTNELEELKTNQTQANQSLHDEITSLKQQCSEMLSKEKDYVSQTTTLAQQVQSLQASLATKAHLPEPAEIERREVESRDRIRLLEQENNRLRDRSVRAERYLTELQQSSTGKNSGDWVTLSWLETKEDDQGSSDDLESASSLRKPSSESRNFLRSIDARSAKAGAYLKQKPVARLISIAYLAAMHIILLIVIV